MLLGCMVLLLLAGLYAAKNWPGGKAESVAPTAAQVQEASLPPQTAAAYRQQRRQESIDITKIDPTIHLEKLEPSSALDDSAMKRNLFRYGAAPAPPPPPKTPKEIEAERHPTPPSPPPPPPIDLKYYGYATDSATKERKVFLTNGQDIFIATEGEIIANRYRIVRIGVNSVEVEDLRNKSRQQLPLVEG